MPRPLATALVTALTLLPAALVLGQDPPEASYAVDPALYRTRV